MNFDDTLERTDSHTERARLIALCALMLIAGAGLAIIAGPPRLPSALPGLSDVVGVLAGSTLPLDPLLMVLLDLAWALWAWICLSIALELALAVAELVAHGAGWLRSVRRIADRVSVPLVRRAVAAAFAVQILSRGVSIAAAQTLPPPEQTQLVRDSAATVASADGTYLVLSGDTLWSIAERAYGSGAEYRRVLEANIGRAMPDGQVFSARGVIQPGWLLVVPDAVWELQTSADGTRWYTVQPGDTLTSIAESQLGDCELWGDLFDLNVGAASPDGKHALSQADLIWPGLRLQLPSLSEDSDSAVEETPAPEPAETTELMVASAPLPPDDSPVTEEPASALPPEEAETPAKPELPPLLRTTHALSPVVLEPTDVVPDSTRSGAQAQANPAGATQISVPGTPWRPDLSLAELAIGGTGIAAAAGLAVGWRRLRRLRPLPKEPESEVVVEDGFAEAQLAQDLTREVHGVSFDPVSALVTQLDQFLAEYSLDGVAVVAVRHGRSSTSITLHCGLSHQPILLDLAPAFAQRLGAEVEACVTADQDVLWQLVRVRKTRLLPTSEAVSNGPCLVPLGVLFDRQMYSLACTSLGHVLVVSMPGHGADTILTSLVATLSARRSPDRLRVWLVAQARDLPAPLFELPHLERVVDPTDGTDLRAAVEELRSELNRRARARDGDSNADLVVVIAELAQLGEHAASLALVAAGATELGVRLVVASSAPDEAPHNPLTPHLTTRMVLHMENEDVSVALLGVADAAFIGGGGRLLLRVDGRETVELYGYQVAAEHLERLVKVMKSSFPAAAPPVPVEPIPIPSSIPSEDFESAESEPPAATEVLASESNATPLPTETGGRTTQLHAVDTGAVIAWPEPPTAPSPAAPPPPAPANIVVAPAAPAAPAAPEQANPAEARPCTPVLYVQCFGGPAVMCGGEQIWPRAGRGDAKPWELLLYLASQPGEGVSRLTAAEALWPQNESVEEIPHRFRQIRYRLRRQLQQTPGTPEDAGILMDRSCIKLDSCAVWSDAHEFVKIVRSVRTNPGPDCIRRLESARALYRGDLFDGPDARRYAWVDERDDSGVTLREHFRKLYENASTRLAELYAEAGQDEAAIKQYRELTEMDPAEERHWFALLRLHAQRGDRQALLDEFERLNEVLLELAEELEGPISAEVRQPGRELVEEFHRLLAALRDPEPATA